MKRPNSTISKQLVMIISIILIFVWLAAFYELNRSHKSYINEAEVRTSVQAQVFAEYSRSTFKRINEFILDIRTRWTGDWESFSVLIQQTRENIDDLTFQVSVIDKEGILAFSSLAKSTDRTDLSQREHFKVHLDAGNADRLFVSRPLMGKVSGKWSIQVTRPIFKGKQFNGVLVLSVNPDQFASFAGKLRLGGESVMTLVRDTGEVMARYPFTETSLGTIFTGSPYLEANAPTSGSYRQNSNLDGIERVFGYYKLPEYGISFVVGESLNDVLTPYFVHRRIIIGMALAVSVMSILVFFILFRSLTALEDVRQQLKIIFQLSPDGFVAFDHERRVKYVNPAFLSMTGLEEDAVIGLDEVIFSRQLASKCKEQACFSGLEALRSTLAQRMNINHRNDASDYRQLIELSDKEQSVLEVCLRESDAEAVSQILFFRNVTRETEVDRMKSEFLAHAAHELRTPMASIYGFSELLLEMDFDEATRRDVLETIHRQTHWLVDIINELLDLARIEARQGKDFTIQDIDLKSLVQSVIDDLPLDGERWPLEFNSDVANGTVHADPAKLKQALLNVLNNAQKYSPSGGLIRIEIVANHGSIGVAVSDQGIGMTGDQIKRVGERFWRADTSGKIPGTGLGMTIVREIIQLHGGFVDVVSKPNLGTTVTLWLTSLSE
ncbi:MAG: ATP-binding protein [Betaproteobacteria bacterium]